MINRFKYFRGIVPKRSGGRATLNTGIPLRRLPLPYEPMRENRFIIRFPEPLNIPEYMVKSTTRPSANFVNGRVTWDDMVFKFYDPIHPSTSQPLFEAIRGQFYNERMNIKIELLDPVGTVISQWDIYGMVSSVEFGNLDYGSDDLLEPTMTIKVDNAIMNY